MSSSQVLKFSEGVVSRITDLTLLAVYYQLNIAFGSVRTLRGVQGAGEKALDDLAELNYQSIKRAIRELKRKGVIKAVKDSLAEIEITRAGRKRLNSLLPQYQKKRPWDKNLYLVTYDVPIGQNYERNQLREYLKRLGCGLLQESIWITPYNPSRLVEEFIENNSLEGTVLVSLLGKDGSIGKMTLEELIEKVYRLEELNARYEEFLAEYPGKKDRTKVVFAFFSILQDDPQLPFELLPEWWEGDRAYLLFRKIMTGK